MANLALLLWAPVTILLFLTLRPSLAAGAALLGSAILLPTGIGPDPPGMPPLTRERLASLLALVAVLALRRPALVKGLRRNPRLSMLAAAIFVIPYLTALVNRDAFGQLPAMKLYDALIISQVRATTFCIPFLLGLALVRRREDVRKLLLLICIAGLGYSLLALWEVRMSPRLHEMLYGYAAHRSWSQAKRFGGWRPMVFMDHGLALGRFMLSVLLAAAVLYRTRTKILGFRLTPAVGYLSVVLVLCKSLGSIVYGVFLLPVVLFTGARRQALVVLFLGVVVLTYPVTRALGIFPTDTLVSLASDIDATRAASLGYRFYNEDLLLDHALERPILGWGGWNRNRVFDERTGKDLSTTDGYWIIIFGKEGLAGFITHFGLLTLPALLVARRYRSIRGKTARLEMVGLAMIVIVNAVDLIPNAFLMNFMIFSSGALAGALPAYVSAREPARAGPVRPDRRAPDSVPVPASDLGPPRLASLLGSGRARGRDGSR